MNVITTPIIESEAKPVTVDVPALMENENRADDLDVLCNFYTNMTIEGLRKLGYQVKVSHYRYTPEAVDTIRRGGLTHLEQLLKPNHELRINYDLAVDQGKAPNFNYIASNGGQTTVEVMEPGVTDPTLAYTADALCSIQDAYKKHKGVLICLGRVFHQLCEHYNFTKSEVVEAVESFRYLSAKS